MNKRGKSWHLIVTALLIVVFSFTALFGVSYTYGDTKNVYIKGAEDIRFGIDIRGGVDVTFMPADDVEATDAQMTAAKTVIEDRLVGLGDERGVLVRVDVGRDAADAHLASRADDAAGDLPAVGDEQRADHSRNTP